MKVPKKTPRRRRDRLNAPSWNLDLTKMPTTGHFQVLRGYSEVFRHMPDQLYVIEPMNGRMFVPLAWRPMPKAVVKD